MEVGEQQPEVEHDYIGVKTETGIHEGRHWRHGAMMQYALDTHCETFVEIEVTYWGGDDGRVFDILANGTRIATQELNAEAPGKFIRKRYVVPVEVLQADNRLSIRFVAKRYVAGGVYELRLMRAAAPRASEVTSPPASGPPGT